MVAQSWLALHLGGHCGGATGRLWIVNQERSLRRLDARRRQTNVLGVEIDIAFDNRNHFVGGQRYGARGSRVAAQIVARNVVHAPRRLRQFCAGITGFANAAVDAVALRDQAGRDRARIDPFAVLV